MLIRVWHIILPTFTIRAYHFKMLIHPHVYYNYGTLVHRFSTLNATTLIILWFSKSEMWILVLYCEDACIQVSCIAQIYVFRLGSVNGVWRFSKIIIWGTYGIYQWCCSDCASSNCKITVLFIIGHNTSHILLLLWFKNSTTMNYTIVVYKYHNTLYAAYSLQKRHIEHYWQLGH